MATAWEELHQGETLYGKRIGSVGKLGGMAGLPEQGVLTQLLNKAQGMDVSVPNSGMSFRWARASVNQGAVSTNNEGSKTDTKDKSSAICYEDRVFPVALGDGHIVVRQSVAPCARCRAAFRAWAKQRQCTIVVASIKGYDAADDGSVFIFAPTGAAYLWS